MTKNHPRELNRAVPGERVEMFAIRDGDYPGGWFYRFPYYHSEDGEILRYDNAHDDITLLADYGLLFIVDEGQSKRPYLPYDRIHLDVEIAGGKPGKEPAPA